MVAGTLWYVSCGKLESDFSFNLKFLYFTYLFLFITNQVALCSYASCSHLFLVFTASFISVSLLLVSLVIRSGR